MEYNGIDHEIYRQALVLAKLFDERFEAAVPPPQHMGIRKFRHGNEWVGSEVVVYWDGDHKWFKARVMAYLGDAGDKGHQYRIQYPDDEAMENVTLPDVNVAVFDLNPALHPHLDPLPPWHITEAEPGTQPPASRPPQLLAPNITGAAATPAAAAAPAPAPAPVPVVERPLRDRQPPAKLQVGVAEGRVRSSLGGVGHVDVGGDAKRGKDIRGGGVGAGDEKGGGSGFIGDDGMPCTLVL